MLTGDLRNQIDRLWDSFWSGGISNPLEVMEQITYLLFLRRLDELQQLEENKANRLGTAIERRFYPEGKDSKGRDYKDLRWSRFKHMAPSEMYDVVSEHVFPFLRTLGSNTGYAKHMKDARFTIPTPALLAKVVDMVDKVPMEDRDTKGDLYEYMLGKIASAGQNGQFRTPRHIIQLMVEMTAPKPDDVICDPASGTCGFLVAAGEYIREHHKTALTDPKQREHFHTRMFHGFDFDNTMLRIGSMNMMLHGVEDPNVTYKDALADEHSGDANKYTLVLANPPFSGSLDYENTAKDLLQVVKTRKTELLFVSLFTRLLKVTGRAAVVVPAGVLESSGRDHKIIRKMLVEECGLEGIIALPHWLFKPYASVSTAILLFNRTGPTKSVWFYRLDNDGFDKGAQKKPVDGSEIPDLLKLWQIRHTASYSPEPTKHRFVPVEELRANDYDLCNRVYLSGYTYPPGYDLVELGQLFNIQRGTSAASGSELGGSYPFATSSEGLRRSSKYSFEAEAICIPTVSSTGHGHASMKSLHYVNGKFDAATICVVLTPKDANSVSVPYVFHYLLAHKDELLVPLMRGTANVSLDPELLATLRVPLPNSKSDQEGLVAGLLKSSKKMHELQVELERTKLDYASAFQDFKEKF